MTSLGRTCQRSRREPVYRGEQRCPTTAPTHRGQPWSGSASVSPSGATTPQRQANAREDRLEEARRDEFGGVKWGAAFFGWLVVWRLAPARRIAISRHLSGVGRSTVGRSAPTAGADVRSPGICVA